MIIDPNTPLNIRPSQTDQPTVVAPAPDNAKKRSIVLIGAGLAGLLIFVFLAVVVGSSGGDSPATITQESEQSTETPALVESVEIYEHGEISESLFKANVVTNDVSVGYVRAPESRSLVNEGIFDSIFGEPSGGEMNDTNEDPSATEPQDLYSQMLFYTKNVQAIEQIFFYNLETATLGQLTNNTIDMAQSTPVFSSVRQQIAYGLTNTEANSGGITCDVHLLNIQTMADDVIDFELPNKTCLQPLAWSPESDKLLLASYENDLSERTGGLIEPYSYDVTTKVVTKMTLPEGFDSLRSFTAFYWLDNERLAMKIVDKNEFGKFAAEDNAVFYYEFDESRQLKLFEGLDVENLVEAEDGFIYATSFNNGGIFKVPKDDNTTQPELINGSLGAVNHVIRRHATTPDDLIFIAGRGDAEVPLGVVGYPLNTVDAAARTLLDLPPASDAYPLTWGENYNEMIYVTTEADGTTTVRMLNLRTKNDLLLAEDVF